MCVLILDKVITKKEYECLKEISVAPHPILLHTAMYHTLYQV